MFYFFFEGEKTTASNLAKYVLKKSTEPLNNLKLQKILYYIQGYYLAIFNRPLFPDDIYAWKFGPVVSSVYYEYSIFGSDILEVPQEEIELDCDLEEIKLIDWVIKEKSHLTNNILNKNTRLEKPWIEATNNGEIIHPNTIIDKKSIKDFFREKCYELL